MNQNNEVDEIFMYHTDGNLQITINKLINDTDKD